MLRFWFNLLLLNISHIILAPYIHIILKVPLNLKSINSSIGSFLLQKYKLLILWFKLNVKINEKSIQKQNTFFRFLKNIEFWSFIIILLYSIHLLYNIILYFYKKKYLVMIFKIIVNHKKKAGLTGYRSAVGTYIRCLGYNI